MNNILNDADSKFNQAKEAVKEFVIGRKPANPVQVKKSRAEIVISSSNPMCSLADAPNIKTDVQVKSDLI